MLNGAALDSGTANTIMRFELAGLSFVPDANLNGDGVASIDFTVIDSGSINNQAVTPNTLTFNVTPVGDAPQGTDGTIEAFEDTARVFQPEDFGFTDPIDGDSPSNSGPDNFASVRIESVTGGTLTLDGSDPFDTSIAHTFSISQLAGLEFTPDENLNGIGVASIDFTVIDDGSGDNVDTTPNTLTVNVTPTNDIPVAANDSAATLEDTAVMIDVLANDNDVDGDTLQINSVLAREPSNGTVTLSNGTFTYTPDANFNGEDSFVYSISDGNGGTADATVLISVEAVNDAPVANNDNVTTLEDTAVTIEVLANDSDVDGDALQVNSALVSDPSDGTVTFSNGTFTYTPNENFK